MAGAPLGSNLASHTNLGANCNADRCQGHRETARYRDKSHIKCVGYCCMLTIYAISLRRPADNTRSEYLDGAKLKNISAHVRICAGRFIEIADIPSGLNIICTDLVLIVNPVAPRHCAFRAGSANYIIQRARCIVLDSRFRRIHA